MNEWGSRDRIFTYRELIKAVKGARKVFVFAKIVADDSYAVQVVKKDLLSILDEYDGDRDVKIFECLTETDGKTTHLYVGW